MFNRCVSYVITLLDTISYPDLELIQVQIV